jgi:hypothetical protein
MATTSSTTHDLNVHDLIVQVLAAQLKTNILLRSMLNQLAHMPHSPADAWPINTKTGEPARDHEHRR